MTMIDLFLFEFSHAFCSIFGYSLNIVKSRSSQKKFSEMKQFYEEQDRERELNGDKSEVHVKKEDDNKIFEGGS